MSDLTLLYLLLVAFYLSECSLWARHGAVVFVGALGRGYRVDTLSRMLGNANGRVVMASALPPLGGAVVTEPWPLIVAPGGVLGGEVWVPFGGGSVAAHHDGRAVWVVGTGRTARARASTAQAAESLAKVIARVASATDRAQAVGQALDHAFDVPHAEARWKSAVSRKRTLTWLAHVVWIELFILAPFMFAPHSGTVLFWMLGVLVTMVAVAFTFQSAHRALYASSRGDRWMKLIEVGFFPPAAARAHDVLLRESMAEHHPLAVGAILLEPGRFAKLARRTVIELRHPLRRESPLSPEAAAADAWLRAEILARAEKLCRTRDVDVESTPARSDPNSKARCPRCDAEYARATGDCDDCPGVGVVPFV